MIYHHVIPIIGMHAFDIIIGMHLHASHINMVLYTIRHLDIFKN